MFDKAEIGRAAFVSISEGQRLALLNSQLAAARAGSPYYREILSGIRPPGSLSELASLPLMDGETLRREGRRLVCVSGGDIARIVSLPTSGSTGAPKRLYFTAGDLARTVRFFAEGMGWLCAPGDRAAVLMPCTAPDGVGDLLCRGLEAIGVTPLPIGIPRDWPTLRALLRREQPAVYVGFPWQLRLLALTCPTLRPRAVLLSGDYVPAGLADTVSRQWHTAAVTHFGMTETGYGCAVQHPAAPTLFLRRDELIAEVIDADNGAPLPPGRVGELVLTTLRREAMPLLRCRTGDLAALTPAGDLAGVFGRISVPAAFYRRQDTLSPLRWLWDYREEGETLRSLCAPDAPANAAALLAERTGLRPVVQTVPAEDAAPLTPGKRVYSVRRYGKENPWLMQ